MRPPLHRIAALALMGGLAALAGCATSPRFDRQFGDALRQSTAQQTLHPEAVYEARPAGGLDGRAAAAAYDNYLQSYTTPTPQSDALSIGVGGHH